MPRDCNATNSTVFSLLTVAPRLDPLWHLTTVTRRFAATIGPSQAVKTSADLYFLFWSAFPWVDISFLVKSVYRTASYIRLVEANAR